ncbi:MAG: hypothetical protein JXQ76_01255 [Campylobacterales bacterium]|nr:hypothetical protein [Campylobacterales bacterium]
MIVPSIISFLKTTKNISLDSIHYGAFETLGSNAQVCDMELKDRVAPIRELTELYQMIEWSEAINAFLHFGDETKLSEQIKFAQKGEISKKLKGQFTQTQENIQKLGNALRFNDLSQLSTIKEVKISNRINLEDMPQLLALKEIATKVEKHLAQWGDDSIQNGFLASRWCLENNRFAQALTFAQESSIGYFSHLFKWDEEKSLNPKDKRGVVTFALRLKAQKINPKTKKPFAKEDFSTSNTLLRQWFEESIEKVLECSVDVKLIENFFNLEEWRNKLNHAKEGDRKKMQNDFPTVLKDFMSAVGLEFHKSFT